MRTICGRQWTHRLRHLITRALARLGIGAFYCYIEIDQPHRRSHRTIYGPFRRPLNPYAGARLSWTQVWVAYHLCSVRDAVPLPTITEE